MPDICSCGTSLVENAVFCHRCGKAQRDLVDQDEVADTQVSSAVAEQPIAPPPPLAALPISFRNTIAVRIGFLVASVASILDVMPKINLLIVIWSVCAGFIAVVLYSRSTGQSLTVRNGARLGWITGALNSMIVMVLFTIAMVSNTAELTAALQTQMRSIAPGDPNIAAIVDSPYMIPTVLIFTLFLMFVICTIASIAGGALGARITRDESRTQLR